MRYFDRHWLVEGAAREMWRVARSGTFDVKVRSAAVYQSTMRKPYLERCRAFHTTTGTMLIFTRDEGEDLRKAAWYIDREIARIDNANRNDSSHAD